MSRSNVGQRPSHLPMPKRRSTKRTRRSARRIVRWRADGVRMAGLGGLWHRGSPSVERQAKCASLSHPEEAGFLEQGHRQNLNARGGGRTHMSAFSLTSHDGIVFFRVGVSKRPLLAKLRRVHVSVHRHSPTHSHEGLFASRALPIARLRQSLQSPQESLKGWCHDCAGACACPNPCRPP